MANDTTLKGDAKKAHSQARDPETGFFSEGAMKGYKSVESYLRSKRRYRRYG